MKRTAATWLMASLGRLRRPIPHPSKPRRTLLVGAFFAVGATMFFVGRVSSYAPENALEDLRALQTRVRIQQREVDHLAHDTEQSVNALAVRLAELQAASTRLDALGERLAQMGQLSLDEFDFTEPAAVGGPEEIEAIGPAGEGDLRDGIAKLSDKLRRQASQLDALQFLMVNRKLESDLTPAGWPVRKGWISSRFGERSDPFTGKRVRHRGLDFAGTAGTEVLSVASGVVTWAANRTSYGNTVEIDHGNGFVTRYAHNQKLAVKAGQHVNAGQVIAWMGSTGRSSAPHVHFEVLKEGVRINPSSFVAQLR